MVAPSRQVVRQRPDPLTGLVQQVAPVVRRHFADDLHRKRNALPEAVESGSLGEVCRARSPGLTATLSGGACGGVAHHETGSERVATVWISAALPN
jgi:hypothetical protein